MSDEALGVHRRAVLQPGGVGIGADEQEQMAQRAGVSGAVGPLTEYRGGEAVGAVALERHDLLADVQVDIRQRADAVDQVARHRRLEPGAAHDQVQALDLGREEHDRLARRVAAADQRHLLALAQLRLDRRRPVGDARTLEGREVGDVGPAIARAGGDDHGARPHGAAVGELQAAEDRPGCRAGPPQSSRATSSGIAISAPNFSAWLKARPASAMPEMPVGKPR